MKSFLVTSSQTPNAVKMMVCKKLGLDIKEFNVFGLYVVENDLTVYDVPENPHNLNIKWGSKMNNKYKFLFKRSDQPWPPTSNAQISSSGTGGVKSNNSSSNGIQSNGMSNSNQSHGDQNGPPPSDAPPVPRPESRNNMQIIDVSAAMGIDHKQRSERQKEAVKSWVNRCIGHLGLFVNDLSNDMVDGRLFFRLLEVITNKTLKGWHENPTDMMMMLDNLTMFLKILGYFGIKISGISAEDIYSGNENIIVAILLLMIKKYTPTQEEFAYSEEYIDESGSNQPYQEDPYNNSGNNNNAGVGNNDFNSNPSSFDQNNSGFYDPYSSSNNFGNNQNQASNAYMGSASLASKQPKSNGFTDDYDPYAPPDVNKLLMQAEMVYGSQGYDTADNNSTSGYNNSNTTNNQAKASGSDRMPVAKNTGGSAPPPMPKLPTPGQIRQNPGGPTSSPGSAKNAAALGIKRVGPPSQPFSDSVTSPSSSSNNINNGSSSAKSPPTSGKLPPGSLKNAGNSFVNSGGSPKSTPKGPSSSGPNGAIQNASSSPTDGLDRSKSPPHGSTKMGMSAKPTGAANAKSAGNSTQNNNTNNSNMNQASSSSTQMNNKPININTAGGSSPSNGKFNSSNNSSQNNSNNPNNQNNRSASPGPAKMQMNPGSGKIAAGIPKSNAKGIPPPSNTNNTNNNNTSDQNSTQSMSPGSGKIPLGGPKSSQPSPSPSNAKGNNFNQSSTQTNGNNNASISDNNHNVQQQGQQSSQAQLGNSLAAGRRQAFPMNNSNPSNVMSGPGGTKKTGVPPKMGAKMVGAGNSKMNHQMPNQPRPPSRPLPSINSNAPKEELNIFGVQDNQQVSSGALEMDFSAPVPGSMSANERARNRASTISNINTNVFDLDAFSDMENLLLGMADNFQ